MSITSHLPAHLPAHSSDVVSTNPDQRCQNQHRILSSVGRRPAGFSIQQVLSRSVVSDSATPWTVAHQAVLCVSFSRQEYWSGLPHPPPGDLPTPGIEPASPASQADSLQTPPETTPLATSGYSPPVSGRPPSHAGTLLPPRGPLCPAQRPRNSSFR